MNVEAKLKLLFDFQKYENNSRLARMIEEAEGYAELSDESLSFVNAAGEPNISRVRSTTEPEKR